MDVDKVLDQRWDGHIKLEAYLDTNLSPTQTPDQSAFKFRPRSHTGSDFDDLYMDAKLTKIHFQCHQSHFQITFETSGIDETN